MREQLVGLSLRRPLAVLIASALVALSGFVAAGSLERRLSAVTSVPGSPSADADILMQRAFGDSFAGTFTIIIPFGNASDAAIADLKARLEVAIDDVPTARVEQMRAIAGTLYALIGTDLSLIEASAATPDLRRSLTAVGLVDALVTGPPALEHDVRPALADDLRRGAVVGGCTIALLLFLAFGRSRLIVIPAVTAVFVIGISLAAVSMLSLVMPVVPYVPNVVELVGLGIAIDYGLLLAHRLRTESRNQSMLHNAIRNVFASAGRTVWWAGVTAGMSLLALVLIPVPFIRSLAIAGVVVPLVAVVVAHASVPALMAVLKPREGNGGLLEVRSGSTVGLGQRQPMIVLTLSAVALILLSTPLASIRIAPASLTAIPSDVPAMQAVRYLEERIGPGAITPHELLIDVGRGEARSQANDAARTAFATWLADQSAVFGVFSETSTNYIDATDRYQRILVLGRYGFADERTADFVSALRTVDLAAFGYRGATVFVGGAPAQGVDFLDTLRIWVPFLLVVMLGAAWLAMSRILRSHWLAGISIALNLLTLSAVCGVLVWLFQRPVSQQLPVLLPVPQLESWALLLLVVLLFALTLDYQLFLLTRIRESFLTGQDVSESIQRGLRDTSRVIVFAALAFIGALSGLILGQVAGLQQLGVGLAFGVLLDASVVRLLMLPAFATLIRRNIWTLDIDERSGQRS